MTTFERKIGSVQEYNLLKLLQSNTNQTRLGMEWIQLNHELCRAFATNGYAMVIADLEPNWWDDIFDGLPELVLITKLNRNEAHYFDGKELDKIKYHSIFEAIGKEPEYEPVMHLNLNLLRNLLHKFDDVYFVKQSGKALFMQLEGDKYPAGKYYGALMPKTITKEESAKIIEALGSLATDSEERQRWVADCRNVTEGNGA